MLTHPAHAKKQDSKPIPRVIYALYDADTDDLPRSTLVHNVLEMPLNWLGYHMEFIEKDDPLPKWRDDVAGVVLWLPGGEYVEDQESYLNWLEDGLKNDKKMLVFGNFGVGSDYMTTREGKKRLNDILSYIGIHLTGDWNNVTYNASIVSKDPKMTEYERAYKGLLPSYHVTKASKDATQHLRVKHTNSDGTDVFSDLITTHPNGGYVAARYAFYYELDIEKDELYSQRWLINPFAFVESVFGRIEFPKPDVTTLTGRRIFYSHLDGDGWNNLTEVRKYVPQRMIASEVLLHEIYVPYKNLPFTVAPIVSDLREDCYGLSNSLHMAVKIFALSNVEPASHTYSHPLLWRYFENYQPQYEVPFLPEYPDKPKSNRSLYDAINNALTDGGDSSDSWQDIIERTDNAEETEGLDQRFNKKTSEYFTKYYKTPRSYACEPFNLTREIKGSVEYLQELAPEDKKISLLQWSGNTSPAENAIAEVRKHSFYNINGGDSRFDGDYPSYSYVAPIGIKVGDERQIYSSNSNENTYTHLWSDQFFGFRHLVNTVKNTESPRRISPFNIYYHSYSAEKRASLEALKQNLNYALSQDIIPIFTSDYARIANGYYSTDIIPVGKNRWRIENRGTLQTMRFDKATLKTIDWKASKGIIGHRHYQGSLYVFLNPKDTAPTVALKPLNALSFPIPAAKPYLIESRWNIQDFKATKDSLTITAQGFGRGVMQFYWPDAKKLDFTLSQNGATLIKQEENVNDSGEIKLVIHENAIKPVTITLTKK